jgi:hypothetical protein
MTWTTPLWLGAYRSSALVTASRGALRATQRQASSGGLRPTVEDWCRGGLAPGAHSSSGCIWRRVLGGPKRGPRPGALWSALWGCAGLLAIVVGIAAGPAGAVAAECPNEAVRAESNMNPTTGESFSLSLPECRAYEMVSPLEKQGHDAMTERAPAVFASAQGDGIEWIGQGAFAGAENYTVHGFAPGNPYVAQRSPTGWATRSAYPPPSLIEEPGAAYSGSGVFSPNLEYESVCGTARANGTSLRCALRGTNGLWSATPEFPSIGGGEVDVETEGASRNGEVYVFQEQHVGVSLLPADTSLSGDCENVGGSCSGIYEVTGIGTQSPELRLVDVNSNNEMIGPENAVHIGAYSTVPPYGGAYQAISADGAKIFFTATPSGGLPTLYARIRGTETVAISNPAPSECTTCSPNPTYARFQGASASGEKVFLTTEQQLLNSDTDSEADLYEYDFANPAGHELVQVSGGGLGDVTPGAGAQVQGVVDVSEDGGRVYFVAQGVLTTLPNGIGQIASKGADNLYAYDTAAGETKFVATLVEGDKQLWGENVTVSSANNDEHTAQATPDGRYLVFDSYAKLITAGPEADTSGAQQVYRYDFDSGKLVRVSVGHDGYADNGNVPGRDAVVASTNIRQYGAAPTINDSNRAISENGATVAFVTSGQLQSTDVAVGAAESCAAGTVDAMGPGCEVYLWHECPRDCADGDSGEVNMISDGQDPTDVIYAGMSATASDIFFQTRTQLVGQDTDELGDIYDARIDGGFPSPEPEPSCTGEACQGTQSLSPTFKTPPTATTAPNGNLAARPFVGSRESKPKSSTRAEKLAETLKRCTNDEPKSRRNACRRRARKKYGSQEAKKRLKGQRRGRA